MMNAEEKDTHVIGQVVEALPNALFRVKIDDTNDGNEVLVYLSGKMRMNRIRVMIGDKVKVKLDPYGGKGRIVKRL